MGKIVAIGGVTPPLSLDYIDIEIIRLTGKRHPKILYIPTAGGDNLSYCRFYRGIYESRFGCEFHELFLINETPTQEQIREKVFSSDIVYIGGGSSARLMDYFIRFNLNNILAEAFDKGIVLAGISAGALCFGEKYFDCNNPADFKNKQFKDFIKVNCLGLLKFIICPHYNLEGYCEKMDAMIREYGIAGIAVENNCAFEFVDGRYRIISTIDNTDAYKVYLKEGNLVREVIPESVEFRELDELMQ